jgi:hypothetical protein
MIMRLLTECVDSYAVPGQWQGTYRDTLEIIGDKKGGTTAAILARKPEEIDRVRDLVQGMSTHHVAISSGSSFLLTLRSLGHVQCP